jgi:hypothetical protein
LQLKDGSATLEAKTLSELAAQLGAKYPDGEYERTLHQERDRESEERRAQAMNQLIKILAEAAMEKILNRFRCINGRYRTILASTRRLMTKGRYRTIRGVHETP